LVLQIKPESNQDHSATLQ